MLFNSMAFAIFLPIVFILYWMLPHKYRWILLLSASYYFYMSWNAKYIVLIVFTTIISYTAARLLENEDNPTKKKIVLGLAAFLCLGVLFFFKYFTFFNNTIVKTLSAFSLKLHPLTLDILIPVGISFYTFQTLSYVIDVYREKIKAEHHFGIYATFIAFFPQLVAGPIERTENLMPQIKREQYFDYEKATYGIKLMAWGFFKKLAIADVVARYVNAVFNSPRNYNHFDLIIVSLFFTVQIYCDFSGYSDIAIGTAKLMGIDLMTNFKSPYFSTSVKEFWNKWHISLSTWFRDYVYIPLGGNRCSAYRHSFNLLITFLISGLWHGANWTFVIWGGIHGAAQVIENTLEKWLSPFRQTKAGKIIAMIVVFIFCDIAWIFFRADSLSEAFYIINHIFCDIGNFSTFGQSNLEISKINLLLICINVSVLAVFDFFSLRNDVIRWISERKIIIRWSLYLILIWMILITLPLSDESEFIYFQF